MGRSHQLRKASFAAVALATLLVGCSAGNEPIAADEQSTLKVMYHNEQSFYQQYGMLFSALHPNVEIEVVSTQSIQYDSNDRVAAMKQWIEENKPDIIMADSELIRQLGEEGQLLDLETEVQKKEYRADTLVPGLLDHLREQGGGKLYALTPSMYSQVIYYNKDLFNKHGVDLPTDRMSWEELFALAQRFPTDGPTEDRVYGFSFGYSNDPYQLGSMIASSQQLNVINPADMQVTLDTPAWRKAFESAFQILKSNALYTEEQGGFSGSYEDYLLRDPFISGKLAMKMDSIYTIEQIKEAQANPAVKDKVIKDWAVVTMPVDPQSPDQSPYVNFSSLFAVSAKSTNAEVAKDFIAYITGEDYARVTSKLQRGDLSVRTTAYDDPDNRNLQAFYALKPVAMPASSPSSKVPQQFYMQSYGIVQSEIQSAYDGRKSLDDALKDAQTQLQATLLQAQQEEQNASPEPTSNASVSSGVAIEQAVTVTE